MPGKPLVLIAILAASIGCASTQAQDIAAGEWEADTHAYLDLLLEAHEAPYYFTPEDEFTERVDAYIASLPTLTYAERVTGLASIAAMVGDGHTWMPMYDIPFGDFPPGPDFDTLSVRLASFSDGLFIVGVPQDSTDLLGCAVRSVAGTPVEEAIARVMTILPQDAPNFSTVMMPEWLMRDGVLEGLHIYPGGPAITLSLDCPSGAVSREIGFRSGNDNIDWVFSDDTGFAGNDDWQTAETATPLWRQASDDIARWETLGDIAYVQIGQIRDLPGQSLGSLVREAVDAVRERPDGALILDLRRTLGGDGTLNPGIIAAINSAPVLAGDNRLIALTSNVTHSAAIMLVSRLEQETGAFFVGQPTADRPNHHGETNIYILPNTQMPILHASEYYQTSSPDDDRPYQSPDFSVEYRFEDYAAGRDPVLEFSLSLIEEGMSR